MTDDIQLKVIIWIVIWLQNLKALASKILTQEDFIIFEVQDLNQWVINNKG